MNRLSGSFFRKLFTLESCCGLLSQMNGQGKDFLFRTWSSVCC
jgi:hypothetical protein